MKQYDSRNPSRGYNIAIAPGKDITGPRAIQSTKRCYENENVVVISVKDAVHDMCLNCDYNCKQSIKNEIVMCRKIAESL